MARLSNEAIESLYERLELENHPDSIGALARSMYITKFDEEYDKDGRKTIWGIKPSLLPKYDLAVVDLDVIADQIATVLVIDSVNRTKLDSLEQMHVAWYFNDRIARQENWSKKIRRYVSGVKSHEKIIRKILGEPVQDEEAEFDRDILDREMKTALEQKGGIQQREGAPTTRLEQLILTGGDEDSLSSALNELLKTGELDQAEVNFVTNGRTPLDQLLEKERAIAAVMEFL